MYCVRCQHDVVFCECDDITERLSRLSNHPGFVTDRCTGCRNHPDRCMCETFRMFDSSIEHREICDGNPKPMYDRDSGQVVIGWECPTCERSFSRNDRVRDGITFRYMVFDNE